MLLADSTCYFPCWSCLPVWYLGVGSLKLHPRPSRIVTHLSEARVFENLGRLCSCGDRSATSFCSKLGFNFHTPQPLYFTCSVDELICVGKARKFWRREVSHGCLFAVWVVLMLTEQKRGFGYGLGLPRCPAPDSCAKPLASDR